jgi:predicted CopG family antitoxin
MAHKTITISEEAYEALAASKGEKESFTETILKLTERKKKGTLLDYVRSLKPDEEFAETLEEVVRERRAVVLKAPKL